MDAFPDGFSIGTVKIFTFLELEQKFTFFKGFNVFTVCSAFSVKSLPNEMRCIFNQGIEAMSPVKALKTVG